MPRSGINGTYSLPPGVGAYVPGTTILSAPENSGMQDIAQTFNTPTPIAYGGTNADNASDARTNLGLQIGVNIPSISGLPTPVNLGLSGAVASNALTISLKGADGNDPSATNIVSIPFRSVTLATGTPTSLTVTAATSLVISSGSTMGFTSGSSGRLWIVGFNDSGTFRLGAVNVLSSQDIYPLRDGIYSSTAEGGAGAADSAQVIYTGTAVTDKAMTILGYMDWAAGLVTAGTWAIAPTTIQVMEPGIAKPGEVIQIRRTTSSSLGSGTTITPVDDTIPQITEGTEFMTVAITPFQAPNLLSVSAKAFYNHTVDGAFITNALFRDATANALSASSTYLVLGGGGGDSLLNFGVKAGSVSSTTFRIRGGANIAGTLRLNGSIARYYGGVINSYLEVQEIMA